MACLFLVVSRWYITDSSDQRFRAGKLTAIQVPDAEVPQVALWTVIAFTLAITCVNFGTYVGFNAIISLVSISLTCSYVITISCVLWQRWRGGGLPKERFSLGRVGVYVNIAAICTMSPIVVLAP